MFKTIRDAVYYACSVWCLILVIQGWTSLAKDLRDLFRKNDYGTPRI